MKKNLLKSAIIFLSVLTFSSCYTTKYFGVCKYNLNNVQNLTDETDNSVNIKSRESLLYKDSIINIQWIPNEKEIAFVLENVTNSVISIDWNNVVYYDPSGKSCRTMHSGVKFIDRNSAQPSSTIIPKSKLEDIIFPTDNVYFKEGTYSRYGSTPSSWQSVELFSINSKDMNLAQLNADLYKNKDIKVLMPITYKNKTINYIFNFNISDVKVSQRQEYDYMSTYLASIGISTAATLLLLLLLL
jgi:hypothetical protein